MNNLRAAHKLILHSTSSTPFRKRFSAGRKLLHCRNTANMSTEVMKMDTALIYDEEMTKYKLLWPNPACEIETPERLMVINEALKKNGLSDRCVSVPVREATDEDFLLVHSKEYLEAVKTTANMNVEELMEFSKQYNDVYFHQNIYHCAKLSAGATLQLVDSVWTGKVRNGMALVRPPGHHSMRSAASGFCVFNNVAIAAQYAKQKHGAKRVLIVDWDVHHGQGVQYSFKDDPSVLYFSWHRFEHQKFWPNLKESDYDYVGEEGGTGFNLNIPWNKVGMTNSDYLSAFCHVLLPIAYEFSPDLVLVSAGFDAAIGDPEGKMCATPDIFAHLTHLLMNLAGGKLCLVLEGGYNLTSLQQSVCQTVHTLLGDPAPRPAYLEPPCHSALESIHCVRSAHKPYWSSLRHAAELPTSISTQCNKSEKVGEMLEKEGEEESVEELDWPEPPTRVSPPVRTSVVLPDDVPYPDGCKRFKLGAVDDGALKALMDKMEMNQICNGLALVRDVSMAMKCVVQHASSFPNRFSTRLTFTEYVETTRVLVVCVGDAEVQDSHSTKDGKTLTVHFSNKDSEELIGKYYLPVCLKKGWSDASWFTQAVLGLLLPVGYQYDPSLVVLARMPDCRLCDSVWQQLTAVLQGLAQGHTLVLVQEEEKACVGPTASTLLGEAAPSMGKFHAPPVKDVEALERLRHKLQADWKLLRNTAPETGGGDEPDEEFQSTVWFKNIIKNTLPSN